MNNVTAVIPVREIPFENSNTPKDILSLQDENLLTNKIKILKEIPEIKIIVTTESNKLGSIAEDNGVEVLYRPKEYSRTETPFSELISFVCSSIKTEHIMWSCVTSPLISAETYKKAIDLYFEKIKLGYDSLVTVQKLQRYILDENGTLNYNPGTEVNEIQKLPKLFVFTNGISIAPLDVLKKHSYTCGKRPFMYELNKIESIDICDSFDYECTKYFYKKSK